MSDQTPTTPRGRTGQVLPTPVGKLRRIGLAASAFLSANAFERSQDSRPTGPVVALSRIQPPPARMRARLSWRSTDYIERLETAIREPRLKAAATIAVISPKGGVGKTTVSSLLGSLYAQVRSDRVVAVDADPDFGSLGRALAASHGVFVDDMIEILDSRGISVTEFDSAMGRTGQGLMVIPAPRDPSRMAALGEVEYTRVIRRLQDLSGIVILDCGTGLQSGAVRAALETADQLVLVTDADPATAALVVEAGRLLAEDRVPLTLVVNRMPAGRSRLDLAGLGRGLAQAQNLVVVPEEPDASAALSQAQFNWTDAPQSWRVAIRELAVALCAGWPGLGLSG
ncbi:MAG TPA: MinD/ParA family protein [Candidatus Nitrosotalea sp.]|nr:MinD/ParA family protein [Candidatus Nitrosotalea sp.]